MQGGGSTPGLSLHHVEPEREEGKHLHSFTTKDSKGIVRLEKLRTKKGDTGRGHPQTVKERKIQ